MRDSDYFINNDNNKKNLQKAFKLNYTTDKLCIDSEHEY